MGVPGYALSVTRAVATLLVTTGLVLAMAMPVLAGKQVCSLQATAGGGSATEVQVGEEVLIEGFGFPALLDVEITYSVDGAPIDTVTVTADATGSFETTVTPAAGEEGLWNVTATDIEDICTAETGFLVVGVPAPASPSPSPSPSATPAASQLPNAAADGPNGVRFDVMPVVLAAAVLLAGAGWTAGRRLGGRATRVS
jgi:hypothetical protein